MSYEVGRTSYESRSREIAEALIAIEGVGFRPAAPITFKSGIKSPVYCDNRRFPFWPEQWAKVIRGFEGLIAEREIAVDVVGGVEAAGIPHSAALGFAMRTPSVFIRKELKEHGTKKRVEGGDVTGKRVVLVEDLVTTGGSSIAAIEALRAEGAVVTRLPGDHQLWLSGGCGVVRDGGCTAACDDDVCGGAGVRGEAGNDR